MGEPAELSERDRAYVQAVAKSIVDAVTDDTGEPLLVLIENTREGSNTIDTLILLMAQELVRLGSLELELGRVRLERLLAGPSS